MKKIIIAALLACACFFLLFFAPDVSSMFFVGGMTILCSIGYGVGLIRIHLFYEGFQHAIMKMEEMKKFSVSENWLYVKQMDSFFHNRYLDQLFSKYVKKVELILQEKGYFLPDVENYINEDYLALNAMKAFLNVIPGSLTGIGILGTFYGLIRGLGTIQFSSVDVVVESISGLVGGIDTAFYTSIAGVVLSLLFEIITKISWNDMLTTMFDFYERFHNKIILSEKEQKDKIQMVVYKKILNYLERDNDEKTSD